MANAVDGFNPHRHHPQSAGHPGQGDAPQSLGPPAGGGISEGLDSPRAPSAPPAGSPPQSPSPLVDSPDDYAQAQSSMGALVGVSSQAAPVPALVRSVSEMGDWREVPRQFASDFRAVEAQLVYFPGLNSADRADRMFAFFAKYALQFLALAPHGSTSARPAVVRQFLSELEGLGYGSLSEAMTKQSALRAAEQLLNSSSTEEFLSQASRLHFVAQDSAPRPRAGAEPVSGLWTDPPHPSVSDGDEVPPQGQPPRRAGAASDPDQSRRGQGRWTDKVLGPNLLWNALHLSRGEGIDEEREEDRRLERLGLVALLTLAGIIALVVCLIALL